MRRALQILGWVVAGLAVVAVSAFGYVQATWDRDFSAVVPPSIQASTDSAVIARGEYLVRAVAHCSHCHAVNSDRDGGIMGPLTGGFEIDAGPFGQYRAANLTADSATGLGAVSDGLIARSLRSGITRQGRAAPIMMTSVGPMADQDLAAIVSYLRTQAAGRELLAQQARPPSPRRCPPITGGWWRRFFPVPSSREPTRRPRSSPRGM